MAEMGEPPDDTSGFSQEGDLGSQPGFRGIHELITGQFARIERLLDPLAAPVLGVEERLVPAWRKVTRGEPRLAVTVAVGAAIALQFSLPRHLTLGPRWLMTSLEAAMMLGLIAANPRRIDHRSMGLRTASIVLIAVISAANAYSAGKLVDGLVHATEGSNAGPLLLRGGAVWLTNVIVFALWYWDLDRGGPAARANGVHQYPDFVFVQMQSPELAPPEWEPTFVDYLYLSFTNATAFSPTDVLPLSRWAKLTMAGQSCVSLLTVALVIARAVNILK